MVTNAGGINVASCAEAVEKVAKDNGVDLTIATVTGDDLMTEVRIYACVTGEGVTRVTDVSISICTYAMNSLSFAVKEYFHVIHY